MIYLDHNATTPVDPRVFDAMRPYLEGNFANPSSPYTAGRDVSNALAAARASVAGLAGAEPGEVFFTSGGTEGINTALSYACGMPGRNRVLVSAVEHAAAMNYCNALEKKGIHIDVIPVDRGGFLDMEALQARLDERVALVSVMAANNETGVLFPVRAVADAAHQAGALVHVDAVQAPGRIAFSARSWDADFVSLSAHKMHGPKGAGALVSRGDEVRPTLLKGGDQEQGRRPGTENVPGIVGMGAAARLVLDEAPEAMKQMKQQRDQLEQWIVSRTGDVLVVGETAPRLPNTSLLLFDGVEAEAVIALLDMEGVCCSSGSACTAGSVEPSHVLQAMGYGRDEAKSALRLSLGRGNTMAEVEQAADNVVSVIERLRQAS